jgi:hypothetical protein
MSGSPQSPDGPVVCPQPARRPNRPPLFTPFTISLLGLAIAVALWGYGYKLSLYHRHPDRTAVNAVAKLWIKDRSQAAANSHSRVQSDRNQESSALPGMRVSNAPRMLIACNDSRTLPPSQSQIAFDLYSRPPPPTTGF